MTPRLGLASLGFTICLLGCGLRTDPDYSPVCVDDDLGVDPSGTAETGTTDTSDTGDTGTPAPPTEPRSGSCKAPIDLPGGQRIVVRGSLGGCSGTEGWCGGSGAEDVYRLISGTNDVFVEFLPEETNFNPVLRIVRGEDPCLAGTIEESEVCADITNSVPGRGFFNQLGVGEPYYIVVDTELGESGDYAFEVRFGPTSSMDDCLDAVDEATPIELAAGGEFVWEANLEAKQGRLDSACGAPGDDDIFPLVLTGGGTLSASVEVLEGEIQPIVSIRSGCGTLTEQTCGPTTSVNFGDSTTRYLVVDQLGAAEGRYRLTVKY